MSKKAYTFSEVINLVFIYYICVGVFIYIDRLCLQDFCHEMTNISSFHKYDKRNPETEDLFYNLIGENPKPLVICKKQLITLLRYEERRKIFLEQFFLPINTLQELK